MIEYISQPWHWSVAGLGIVAVLFLLNWFGGEFGVSSNLRTICAMGGAGRRIRFFDFDWKEDIWNIVFIIGAVIGGFLAFHFLASEAPVHISSHTQSHLSTLGINTPNQLSEGAGFLPNEIFTQNIFSFRNIILLIGGGFLVGFGTRYAGGCTSGHAISGLANLQVPSLIAVIGFFVGGLIMTWVFLPWIMNI